VLNGGRPNATAAKHSDDASVTRIAVARVPDLDLRDAVMPCRV
jgi:hypothetical protein